MTPIHVARIQPKRTVIYLFLREQPEGWLQWFQMNATYSQEEMTDCGAKSVSSALENAQKQWKEENFRPLHCGFRYSLPERDLVGYSALFWQMAKSYGSFNGHYFDPEVGHLCFVDFASQEALEIWREIRDNDTWSL